MDVEKFCIIINYCSKDKAFIHANIKECLKVTKYVVLSCGNKFFNGEDEDIDHLKELKSEYPSLHVLLFDVDLSQENPLEQRPYAFFHNKARCCGYVKIIEKYPQLEWFLFIDADEIPEGESLLFILERSDFQKNENYTFSNYWYFREPIYQSKRHECSPLLLYRDNIKLEKLMNDNERNYFNIYEDEKTVKGIMHPFFNIPVFHHFSWVRSEENMYKKIEGWGHKDDKDWKSMIEEEFSHEFNFIEPIYGNECIQVDNIFNIINY